MVTLRGPKRTVELKLGDPEQFKRIVKVDRIEATSPRRLCDAVERAKSACRECGARPALRSAR